jgi:hypothetical protein
MSEYLVMLEQTFNLANIYRQAEFQLVDHQEKREEFEEQISYYKSKGKL